MVLYCDFDDEDHRFYKNLNEDIYLKPDEYNRWDMQFRNGDLVNLTGKESLRNAVCIGIMTRYQELKRNPLYSDFGCRIHELIKVNKSSMTVYKIELFIQDVLESMRRVKRINWIEVTDSGSEWFKYNVQFSVTCINDEMIVEGSVDL